MSSRTDQPYGVKVLVEGTDPIVDLVTVHGLDGHRERTWTAKNEVSWLRDHLPKVVPNARILVYGYDGRTRSSEPLSCQKLHDHAISLVTDLTPHRTVKKTTKRPIIFIAHSIGGIIVKDALIHSNSANKSNLEHHNAIKTSTYGILFFGTPHQGSDILTLTRTLMDTASRKKANHDIFKNLEKGSELLQKQIGQYNHISSHFVTKCFYEAYKSSSGKGTTVPPDSAVVPGATNVETFPIYSNHEDMVKYESMDNDSFKRVSSCLQVMVEDAVERVTDNWQRWERVKAAESNGMQITFDIPFEPEYPKNEHFTGRQGLLDRIHQTIEEAQSTLVTVVLCGTGGVGKTQIASEYTHTYQKEYQSIFWINAATRESMELGFRTVAQRLIREHAKIAHATDPNYSLIAKNLDMIGAVDENGSIYPQEDYTDCIIRGVKMWLAKERNENWLLVIDNADDLEDMALETFIPTAAHGTIIITSRRTNWGSFKTVLEVEVMQEQEGKLLLLKSAGLEEDPIAEDVVTKLGSLPLAIVQAGAYILIHQMPLKRYLEIYEECFNTIFGEPPSKANWHYGNRTVRTTWEISFKAIANTNKQAAELLSLCSFISNENIYDDMLRRGKQLQKNDITLDTALGLLFSYSLAQRKELNDSFYIHPVVHLWAHMRLGESEWVQKTKEAVGMIPM